MEVVDGITAIGAKTITIPFYDKTPASVHSPSGVSNTMQSKILESNNIGSWHFVCDAGGSLSCLKDSKRWK